MPWLFLMMALSGSAHASTTTIDTCISAAEAATSGRSITVSLGSSPQLTTSDVNSAFDKIAELHTDPLLAVTYNSDARSALRSAMDCIFDATLMTISTVYLNENVPDLAVRTYTGRVVESGTPTDYLYFKALETSGSTEYIHLEGTLGRWDCAYLEASPYMAHDRFADGAEMSPRCLNNECAGRCHFYPELENRCECALANSCSTVWEPGSSGGNAILDWIHP